MAALPKTSIFALRKSNAAAKGGLAQLARALAWHARGRRFDPDTLHFSDKTRIYSGFFYSAAKIAAIVTVRRLIFR